MNRQERRTRIKQLKRMGATSTEAELLNALLKNAGTLKEGDKVRLNYEKLVKEQGYENRLDNYRSFIEENKDTVFTVAFDDKFKGNKQPTIVTLAEDPNTPKWLWYVNDLVLVND